MGSTASAPRDPTWPVNRFPVDAVEVCQDDLRTCPAEFPENMEVVSDASLRVVRSGSLVDAALIAFASHYPLKIRPDDIWSLLTYGFAKHVDLNAEQLRSRFVKHEGKLQLTVDVRATFTVGNMTAEEWTREVFPEFSKQIREHIGGATHDAILPNFSTTTVVDRAASEITLMAAMKNYFSYGMRTLCGIPYIELAGTKDDWELLARQAEALFRPILPEYADLLQPVLGKFVSVYDGDCDPTFWRGLCKRVQHGRGSGSYTTVSGWISVFYLYLGNGVRNTKLKPWQDLVGSDGPEPGDFPRPLSSAPVTWECQGRTYPMHFHAGVLGVCQDPETKAVYTVPGWYVTHDPE